MKEYIEKNQPIFYNLIKNEFSQQRIPHAFLLIGNNTNIPLTYLAMSLICDETLACENCNDCRKVKENKYSDIIRFNGKDNSIKKGNIELIQDTFKKSSLEGKAKIYIIENIEYATKEAMNTLLKMLEEPTEGIYAIFTANNASRVLPTILSAHILAYLAPSIEEAKTLYDERFEYMQLQVINFIEDLFLKRANLIINTQTNLLKKYKERDDIKLFLNMLVLAMKDMFHVKHTDDIVYCEHQEFLRNIKIDESQLIKQIEIILETIYTIESNANVAMLMDSMMYSMMYRL